MAYGSIQHDITPEYVLAGRMGRTAEEIAVHQIHQIVQARLDGSHCRIKTRIAALLDSPAPSSAVYDSVYQRVSQHLVLVWLVWLVLLSPGQMSSIALQTDL